MRAKFLIPVGAAVVAAACGGGAKPAAQGAVSAAKTLPPVESSVVTPAERSLFGALPARMDAPGETATGAQIALGRTLYYETVLSEGHDVSCNSCHALNGYGADGRRVSFGHKGQLGSRNAPTVYNAAAQVAQFWDGRSPSVEAQAKGPILNPAEMGMPDSAAVLAHLRGSPQYRAEFAAAFPDERDPISYDNVGRAIGAFERGLVTPSRWDRFLQGDSSAITEQERRGAKTFVAAGCTACHSGTYVGGQVMQKAGLVHPWPASADSGRYAVTRQPADLMVFKVPTLRNVEMTGPYFSDGSVASLDTPIAMMGRYQLGLQFTPAQIGDIHAWLRTLTGEIPVTYVANPPLPAGTGF
ncbi:MAG: c-type cytochrome [Gemmatimonadota bacterium]|nr:c-type cytochrome [Gemmatimonadota bacterium]